VLFFLGGGFILSFVFGTTLDATLLKSEGNPQLKTGPRWPTNAAEDEKKENLAWKRPRITLFEQNKL